MKKPPDGSGSPVMMLERGSDTVMPEKLQLNPLLKFTLDVGPLVVFFLANGRFGIFVATAVFMVSIVAALLVSYVLTRHWPIMPVVSAIVVLIFGSLTLILHDETFIKVKPTIIYLLFGGVLLVGHILNKPLLAIVFDSVFHLTEEGWRKLTLRWVAFFFVLALMNEVVWRTQTTDVWLGFKLLVVGLTFVFAAFQYPLLTKYAAEPLPKE
jgi:intracellular septation protein